MTKKISLILLTGCSASTSVSAEPAIEWWQIGLLIIAAIASIILISSAK